MTTWTEADLRTGLSEGGTALSDLPNAIGGLRAIGAERVARHLESLIGKRPES